MNSLIETEFSNFPEVHISSVTGNTRKLADAVLSALKQNPDYRNLPKDLVLIFFWCRRGSMDDRSLNRLAALQGRPVLAFGTLGHVPNDAYGQRVHDTVTRVIEKHNTCLGVYLCQGKIDEKRTEKRRALSPDHRHYLDDEGYAKHLASRSHPDADDLAGGVRFLEQIITEVQMSIPS